MRATPSGVRAAAFVAAAAWALTAWADPPSRPEAPAPRPPVPGECLREAPQSDPCGAVCLPLSWAQEYEDTEDYAAHLEAHVRVLELELRAAELDAAAARAEAARWREEALRPTPLVERPIVGVLGGVGLCAASGWALGQAGR